MSTFFKASTPRGYQECVQSITTKIHGMLVFHITSAGKQTVYGQQKVEVEHTESVFT